MAMKKRCMRAFVVLVLAGSAVVAQEEPSAAAPDALKSPSAPQEQAPNPPKSPAAVASASSPPEILSQDQIKELIRQAAEKDIENDKKQRDYTYIQREEEHKLDGKGESSPPRSRPTRCSSSTASRWSVWFRKTTSRFPTRTRPRKKRKSRRSSTSARTSRSLDREKRLKKEEKEREEGREFVREVNEAYNFHLVGIEQLGGRDAYVIDAEPRPGFEPHLKDAKIPPQVQVSRLDRQGRDRSG